MRVVMWRCDGCGEQVERDDNPFTPVRITVEVAIPTNAFGLRQTVSDLVVPDALFRRDPVDVCDACKTKLMQYVNVKEWYKKNAPSNG